MGAFKRWKCNQKYIHTQLVGVRSGMVENRRRRRIKLTTGIAIPGRSIIVSVHVAVVANAVVVVLVVTAVVIVRFAHRVVHGGKKFHNFLTVQHGHSIFLGLLCDHQNFWYFFNTVCHPLAAATRTDGNRIFLMHQSRLSSWVESSLRPHNFRAIFCTHILAQHSDVVGRRSTQGE